MFVCSFRPPTSRSDYSVPYPTVTYCSPVRSFNSSYTVPTYHKHPSIQQEQTRQGKSQVARSTRVKQEARLAPSYPVFCRQLPAYSPITSQAVRAKGCEPFGCFEYFVRHRQLAHAHRETHSTSDRTAQIYQYPLSVAPNLPATLPKDTKSAERES